MQYDFRTIEQRWQERWAQQNTFRTPGPGDESFSPDKPKYYVLDMFPYPSGVGLHVGHPLGYIATDIVARYRRMRGFNVLHPMGYDAFGLPAEQFAVEHGVHPRDTTEKNIANMTRQLKRLGLSYDWDRCLATTDPGYYKWTQWIFLQLYNSYFDPIQKKARPISELIEKLQGEDYYLTPDADLVESGDDENLEPLAGTPVGIRKWYELDADQQRALLDEYRLAYLAQVPVNWCPALGTVLANEEVTNEGLSERGNHPVFKRPLKQWMLRITAYAERLLEELDWVDWPEPIKLMQRNWIGRSEGAYVNFALDGHNETIVVYTTRPDTLFGATYMVLAPEHPLVDALTTGDQREAVAGYRAQVAKLTDMDRLAETKTKTGVFTGAYAVNPVNDEKIPIWIADYVLMGYGTGAIMAVPGHDTRDFEFAKAFDLPIRPVVMPPDEWLQDHKPPQAGELQSDSPDGPALEQLRRTYLEDPAAFPDAYTGVGISINSENDERILTGKPTAEAKEHITYWLAGKGLGRFAVQYKLRDWLFSRQRYWGEPFPILHGPDGEIVALEECDLPVTLPPMDDFTPHASDDPDADVQTPLSRAPDAWKYVERDGKRYTRELNTMPQWAGSCWYYLRFCDPGNDERLVGEEAEKYWMVSRKGKGERNKGQGAAPSSRTPQASSLKPSDTHAGGVDLYVGGAEHAVLHLLYSRFWHKVLYDLGHVSTPEPFGRLFNQGYIQADAYTDERGVYVPAEEVEHKPDRPAKITRREMVRGVMRDVEHETAFYYHDRPVVAEYGKMGKSLKNAVNPDDMCEQYGCDSLRLYEMYLGPLDQSKPWRTQDIVGVHRFLQRVWRNFIDQETGDLLVTDEPADDDTRRLLHKTIAAVTDMMNGLAFNTAIAKLIELNNALVKLPAVPREVAEPMVLMLAPLAPHIAEELWQRLGHERSLAYEPWPGYDESLLVEDHVEVPVQIMGKVRTRITVPADADDQAMEAAALADDRVKELLAGKTVRKVIVAKGRLVNIVAN